MELFQHLETPMNWYFKVFFHMSLLPETNLAIPRTLQIANISNQLCLEAGNLGGFTAFMKVMRNIDIVSFDF